MEPILYSVLRNPFKTGAVLNSVYWSYLLGRDLDKIKKEWPNILKVIKWASQFRKGAAN